MKTTSLARALALASALFAHAPQVNAQPAGKSVGRGAIEVSGRAVKAVTAGPALIHGYSEFPGGAMFVAPVTAGTDADCATALANHPGLRPTALTADRVAYVQVGAGQTACLVTDTSRSFELLWHAFAVEGNPTYVASAKTR